MDDTLHEIYTNYDRLLISINKKIKTDNITQKLLSERTGIPPSTLSRIINNQLSPTVQNACAICKVLEISIDNHMGLIVESIQSQNESIMFSSIVDEMTTETEQIREQVAILEQAQSEWMKDRSNLMKSLTARKAIIAGLIGLLFCFLIVSVFAWLYFEPSVRFVDDSNALMIIFTFAITIMVLTASVCSVILKKGKSE